MQSGSPGFGNARATRNAVEAALRRQSARVLAERAAGLSPDPLLLAREDLLGPRYLDASSCPALAELQGMVGLDAVKQQVRSVQAVFTMRAGCNHMAWTSHGPRHGRWRTCWA